MFLDDNTANFAIVMLSLSLIVYLLLIIEYISYVCELESKVTIPPMSVTCYSNVMGKILVVFYETTQITFYITIIALVVVNHNFQWKGEA